MTTTISELTTETPEDNNQDKPMAKFEDSFEVERIDVIQVLRIWEYPFYTSMVTFDSKSDAQ